jgi:hypothetical protein
MKPDTTHPLLREILARDLGIENGATALTVWHKLGSLGMLHGLFRAADNFGNTLSPSGKVVDPIVCTAIREALRQGTWAPVVFNPLPRYREPKLAHLLFLALTPAVDRDAIERELEEQLESEIRQASTPSWRGRIRYWRRITADISQRNRLQYLLDKALRRFC